MAKKIEFKLVVKEFGVTHIKRLENDKIINALKDINADAYTKLANKYKTLKSAEKNANELTELLGFKIIIEEA